MVEWHVSRAGKVRGPFSEPQVLDLISRGKVALGDSVSPDGGAHWFPAEEAPAFASSLGRPMPIVPPAPTYSAPQPQYFQPPYGYAPVFQPRWSCPKCGSPAGHYLKSKVTTSGWIMILLGLFTCILFPLLFIGLAKTENVAFCKSCRCRL